MSRLFPVYLESAPNGIGPPITAVGSLTEAQIAALTLPFDVLKKPKSVASLKSFGVTCDLSGLDLTDVSYLLRVFVWVKGSSGTYSPKSHYPTPLTKPKVGLFRLSPDVHGGQVRDADTVMVNLPAALGVVHLEAQVRVLVDVYAQLPTP